MVKSIRAAYHCLGRTPLRWHSQRACAMRCRESAQDNSISINVHTHKIASSTKIFSVMKSLSPCYLMLRVRFSYELQFLHQSRRKIPSVSVLSYP